MKKCYFEIKTTPVGRYFFIYKSDTSKAIFVSSSFLNRSSLEACISNIRSHACFAPIHYEHETSTQRPMFIIKIESYQYRFVLIGFEHEIIVQSEPYASIDDCIDSINLIKETAMESKIVDST